MNRIYIGLDVAETLGIAVYKPPHFALVTSIKGIPPVQYELVRRIITGNSARSGLLSPIIVFELPNHFRNGKGTRTLLGRYGYLRWSLVDEMLDIHEVNLNSARAFLKCKSKEEVLDFFLPWYTGSCLTDDHTDALAVAMYQAHKDGQLPDLLVPCIMDWVAK